MRLRYTYKCRDKDIHAEYDRPTITTKEEAENFVLETLRGYMLVAPEIKLEILF